MNLLAWLIPTASSTFFGWQMFVAMRERDRMEEERDALWDELHGFGKSRAGDGVGPE